MVPFILGNFRSLSSFRVVGKLPCQEYDDGSRWPIGTPHASRHGHNVPHPANTEKTMFWLIIPRFVPRERSLVRQQLCPRSPAPRRFSRRSPAGGAALSQTSSAMPPCAGRRCSGIRPGCSPKSFSAAVVHYKCSPAGAIRRARVGAVSERRWRVRGEGGPSRPDDKLPRTPSQGR